MTHLYAMPSNSLPQPLYKLKGEIISKLPRKIFERLRVLTIFSCLQSFLNDNLFFIAQFQISMFLTLYKCYTLFLDEKRSTDYLKEFEEHFLYGSLSDKAAAMEVA